MQNLLFDHAEIFYSFSYCVHIVVVVVVVFSISITSFIPELQNVKINLIANWWESESVCGATVSCDFSGAVDLQLFQGLHLFI